MKLAQGRHRGWQGADCRRGAAAFLMQIDAEAP
jgi:hypothetical protein